MKKILSIVCITAILASCSQKQNNNESQTEEYAMNNSKKENAMSNLKAGKNSVTFKSFGVDLAGDLYLPEGFDPNKKYKAIVGASPFPQLKEQVLATYGPEMAKRGFVFLGFDYLGMGDSKALPGEHMRSRYAFRLIENTWDAVSYLGTLQFVDEIMGLGVCQGGSTIASAAVTDHRMKKLAMVSGMMAADHFQWLGREVTDPQIAAANEAAQKMYETGEPVYRVEYGFTGKLSKEEYVAQNGDTFAATYDYYGRDGYRGPKAVPGFTMSHIANHPMQSLFALSDVYADKIVQPSIIIYGENASTASLSEKFIEKLTCEYEVKKVKDLEHMDFYYKPEAVKLSADAVTEFFNK